MIELFKLAQLPTRQKIHKVIKILELLEFESTLVRDSTIRFSCDDFYLEGLMRLLVAQYQSISVINSAIQHFFTNRTRYTGTDYRTLFNTLRHALYQQTNILPSEWDLIVPGTRYGMTEPNNDSDLYHASHHRPYFSGVSTYIEDIRAPFNLGSLFRTAEAFGAEKIFLSEHCVSPEQARAKRSAMGCVDFLPWSYSSLEELPVDVPIFALETGGTAISSFTFPKKGIVLVGSEELGLSAAALKKATAGVVSIPMKGIKASLNVAVAFGILMQYWTSSIASH